MSLRAFPQAAGAGVPSTGRGKRAFRGREQCRAAGALSSPQDKTLPGSNMPRFAQIHTASLQFKRGLFPLRNE